MQMISPHIEKEGEQPDRNSSKLAVLPGLCCQAAGGKAYWANDIAAAWLLFYTAADIMDSVEDLDQPEEWWQELGPGAAVNMATGLYFTAAQILDQIYHRHRTRPAAAKIIKKMIDGFLIMCSGQHIDLRQERFNLDEYWKTTAAKSGEFFGMACWAGARIMTDVTAKLECYLDFGRYLGLLIQILDDLEEFNNLHELDTELEWKKIQKALPVVYTLEVIQEPKKTYFMDCLERAHLDSQAGDECIQLMEECGVVIYLLAEIERNRKLALSRLNLADPEESACIYLSGMVERLASRT